MLTSASVSPVLSVRDLQQSCRFYGQDLGLREVERQESEAVFSCGAQGELTLHAAPDAVAGPHTVATFEVADLTEEMRELNRHGVRFEQYEGLTAQDGTATADGRRCAWFKDPTGNVLCLHERIR